MYIVSVRKPPLHNRYYNREKQHQTKREMTPNWWNLYELLLDKKATIFMQNNKDPSYLQSTLVK